MSDIDDDSEDVERIRDALELPRDEIDAEARERHLARALEAFDDAPARVVPMRRRRLVSIAAAAAVVLAVVAVGVVIATRGTNEPNATRAADHATSASEHATTVTTAPATPGFGLDTPSGSLGDFPTIDALRAAVPSRYGASSSVLDSKARASAEGAPSAAPRRTRHAGARPPRSMAVASWIASRPRCPGRR